MYNVYFENRKITISSRENVTSSDPNSIYLFSDEREKIIDLPKILQSDNISEIVLCCTNPKSAYSILCSEFSEINAAGGVVENEEGEILIILRNGKWDLPKGKQEEGEDIKTTARREVEEECGIKVKSLGKKICITDHTYILNKESMLKHTYWYSMVAKKCLAFPQTEENITEIAWVKKEDLPKYIADSYPSIIEVIEKAGLL